MIFQTVKRYWPWYLLGVFFLFASSYLQLRGPYILGKIIDVMGQQSIDTHAVKRWVLLLLLCALGTFAARFVWRYCLAGTSRKMELELRAQLFTKLQRLSMGFFSHHKTGDLMAYAINDINAVRQAFGPAIAQLFNGLTMGGISVYSMIAFGNVALVAAVMVPVAVAIGAIVILGGMIRRRFKIVQERFAALSDGIQEGITGIRVLKAYVREENEVLRFNGLNDAMRNANVSMVRVSALLAPVIQFCFGISFALSLIIGGRMVLNSQMSLGDFVAFQGYLASIVAPVMSIGRIINLYQRGQASWHRLTEIYDTPEDVADDSPHLTPKPATGDLVIHDLTFSYPGEERPVLSNINIHLPKGKILGVVGRTGSGKSTLAQLLLRIYDAPEGSIRIGDTPIRDYTLAALRESMGYVPQDGFLFSATIRENLLLFGEEKEEGSLEQAVDISQLARVINRLPQGLDTLLGERGVNLSGGQRQRLAIARALLRRPEILILDDALSSVDTRTESRILEGLKQSMSGTTGIIIAHRISAVREADWIVVLDGGRIVQEGTHDELRAREGFYRELCLQQLGAEQEAQS